MIEKSNEFKRRLCIGYVDNENAFDPTEYEAIFKVLRSIGINETYFTIVEDIYTGTTAGVHVDNKVSEDKPIQRGVRQGDPNSPKLFTATIQEVLKMPSYKRKE